jgi:hypothetical protein
MSESDKPEARIFAVETRFQKLARRAGGIPRDQAIEQATLQIDAARPTFDDWVGREIDKLSDVIKTARPGTPVGDWIDLASTHSRQMRDVGTTMGFELLTYVADSLCEILDAVAAGAELNMDSITCHLDALYLARQRPYCHMKPDQVPELTSGLRRVVERVSTSPHEG